MNPRISPLPALRERALNGKFRPFPCFGCPSTLRKIAVAFTLTAMVITGCGKTTLSPDAYHLVNALDRIFEKRNPQQLRQASDKINEELAAGKITADEAKLLNGLIAKAENDDWSNASSDSRQLLADQTDW